jgi:spermidine synthase
MSPPYGLIPIALATLLLYLISWGLNRLGEISLTAHKRLWNTLLLITFLVTGILGIILVIRINYKLELPWLNRILKWHVHFGIGMTCIAFIHVWWHLKYYGDILTSFGRKSNTPHELQFQEKPDLMPLENKNTVITAIIVLGFSSILSQVITIREFLNVFQGNELIIGLILCIWMLLTAAGSRLGQQMIKRSGKQKTIPALFLYAGFLPVIIIGLLYLLEVQFFLPGTVKGLISVFIFSFVLLLPLCIVTGMIFTLLAYSLSQIAGKNRISQTYGLESAGGLVSGALFSLCLVYLISTFQALALLAAINTLTFWLFHHGNRKNWQNLVLTCILLILSIFIFVKPPDSLIKSVHFRNQELLYTKETPYGNISVTLTAGQHNYYENGSLLFSTQNNLLQEEAVHFALAQHQKPENIMVVSGGMNDMATQIMKYKTIRNIDYVEMNPWLAKAEEQFSGKMSAPILHVIIKDARMWITQTSRYYDVIVVNTPDPSNAQINRYYTLEFFQKVKNALRNGGIFSISLSPTVNYMSPEAKEINSMIYLTLRKVFHYVEVIPGERNYFVASDNRVRIDIARCIEESRIENEYVNPYYIDDELLKEQNQQIMNEITNTVISANNDLFPLAYFLQIRYWLSLFKNKVLILGVIPVLLVILVLIGLRRISPVASGVFTSGFVGASSEFLVIIIFQILYGYVYQMLGLIVAIYMAGLAIGSFITIQKPGKTLINLYILLQVFLVSIVLLLPVMAAFISSGSNNPGWKGQILIYVTIMIIAIISGFQFNLTNRLEKQSLKKMAANLYAIDLAGSACGTLLGSLVFFPLLGLHFTSYLLGIIILMSTLAIILARKRYV